MFYIFFFFNDTATTEIYTLSLHDALPICRPNSQSHSAIPEGKRRRSQVPPGEGRKSGPSPDSLERLRRWLVWALISFPDLTLCPQTSLVPSKRDHPAPRTS